MKRDPFFLLQEYTSALVTGIIRKEPGTDGSFHPFSDQATAKILGVEHSASLHQVHGGQVTIVRESIARTVQSDGMITDCKQLLLITRWADCQNFVVFAPEQNVVGVFHAGWRGLLADIIPNFFAALRRTWNIHPEETIVCGGPSLCMQHAHFTNPLQELPGIDATFFRGNFVDLPGIATKQILDAGVPWDHIERDPDCTCCQPESYWTYRGGDREAVQKGYTNATVAMLL